MGPNLVRRRGDGKQRAVALKSEPGVFRGAGVSRGLGRGPVRVLRTPDPAAMADGDVLVVEFADPGWTPLFPRAAAIVMEVGGTMCHAAVVARELGIPAVFGIRGATGLWEQGTPLVVDGAGARVWSERGPRWPVEHPGSGVSKGAGGSSSSRGRSADPGLEVLSSACRSHVQNPPVPA